MKVVLWAAALLVGLYVIDRLLLWMETRGWIDYRQTYPGRINSSQVGPAFLAIGSLLEPGKRHAVEQQTAVRTEREDPAGGPPREHP